MGAADARPQHDRNCRHFPFQMAEGVYVHEPRHVTPAGRSAQTGSAGAQGNGTYPFKPELLSLLS
jgi:hypothetical protein